MPTLDETQPTTKPVAIAGHKVGPGEPVLIVAEAGVNHNGCVKAALEMVDAAAEAGVDAVKFQVFQAEQLATAAATTASYQHEHSGEATQRELLSKLELDDNAFAMLRERCIARDVLFLGTPFGEADVHRLIGLGVPALKIASTDLTNVVLLDEAAGSNLPVILSTGASTRGEIEAGVDRLLRMGLAGRLILLHCVSRYPTPIDALNLRAIAYLNERFDVPCGLSDHSESVLAGGWAVAAGACILEKHFTLDRTQRGPDHHMSLDPAQLCEYVRAVREMEQVLGKGTIGMGALERDVRAVAAKSIVAAESIEVGGKIARRMLAMKRPGTGIVPGELDRVIGRRAAVAIPADTVLSWDMLS